MTEQSEEQVESTGPRHLPVVVSPKLERHPDDDWVRADPYRLGPSARRALRALIVAVLPGPPAPQPPNIVDRVERHVRSHMPYMHWSASLGMWLTILCLDWSPLFLFKSFRRLHRWDRGKAAEHLRGIIVGKSMLLRMMVVGIRGLANSAYFDQDEVQAAIGYQPVPWTKDRIALRKKLTAREKGVAAQ